MPTTIRDDSDPGHNFQVVVTDISNNGKAVSGAFSEISGLEVSIEAIPYWNGNEDITVRMLPGLKSYTNLTCRRGATGHVEFWNWINDAWTARCSAPTGSIIVQDETQTEVMRWNFSGGWPYKSHRADIQRGEQRDRHGTLEICVENLELDA